MLKKLTMSLAVLLATLAGPVAFAQNSTGQSFPQKQYWASDYGVWSIPSQTANTYVMKICRICSIAMKKALRETRKEARGLTPWVDGRKTRWQKERAAKAAKDKAKL